MSDRSAVACLCNILVHEYAKVAQHLRNDLKYFDFHIRPIVRFIEPKKRSL